MKVTFRTNNGEITVEDWPVEYRIPAKGEIVSIEDSGAAIIGEVTRVAWRRSEEPVESSHDWLSVVRYKNVYYEVEVDIIGSHKVLTEE